MAFPMLGPCWDGRSEALLKELQVELVRVSTLLGLG
jgi:hypothetical protein